MTVLLRGKKTPTQRAIAVLRRFGQDAHVYLPGVGMLNGLQAGNYIHSNGTEPGEVDQPVGLVLDATGGIHATQTTPSAKPILRRGAVNLLTYSGDFSNAVWTKSATTISGNRIIETAATSGHSIAEIVTVVNAAAYTIAVECSAAERNYIGVYAGTPEQGVIFNLTTGAYFGNVVAAPSSYSISPTGYGSYICVINYTATSTASAPSVYLCDNLGSFSYPGDVSKGINVAKMAIFQGTLTAADIIKQGGIPVTQAAPASNPNAGLYSWQFDGSNDSLQLSSVPFQQSDDHYVCAAFELSAVGTVQGIFGASSTTGNVPLVAFLSVNAVPSSLVCLWRDNASMLIQPTGPTLLPNVAYVVTAAKIGNAYKLWLNGVLVISVTGSLGATTVNTANIGNLVRTVTSHQLNGKIYHLDAIKGTLTEPNRKLIETLAAQAAGVTI